MLHHDPPFNHQGHQGSVSPPSPLRSEEGPAPPPDTLPSPFSRVLCAACRPLVILRCLPWPLSTLPFLRPAFLPNPPLILGYARVRKTRRGGTPGSPLSVPVIAFCVHLPGAGNRSHFPLFLQPSSQRSVGMAGVACPWPLRFPHFCCFVPSAPPSFVPLPSPLDGPHSPPTPRL